MKFYIKCIASAFLHIVWFLSLLVPRNRNKWVVGNAKGFFGNTKYFFIHVNEHLKDKKCYFISKNFTTRRKIRQLGYKVYHPYSIIGLFHLLTAKVYVFEMRLTALSYWTSGGVFKVNLWHGVGIKDIESHDTGFLSFLRSPHKFSKPNLFLSTSPMMTKHFSKCFRIDTSACIESDYPRNMLFTLKLDDLISFIDRYEGKNALYLAQRLQNSTRSYIYMPTWRNDSEDFIKTAGFDLKKLNAVLALKNELFIFKLHPFVKLDLNMEQFDNIIFLDSRMDIYPFLPLTDVLITDYSSIYYDYVLLKNKEILLFPFDYDKFILSDNDLAFDYDTYTPGVKLYTFDDLLKAIEDGNRFACEKGEWVKEKFWESENNQDLYASISSKL